LKYRQLPKWDYKYLNAELRPEVRIHAEHPLSENLLIFLAPTDQREKV